MALLSRLKEKVHAVRSTFRESGFRGVVRRFGWKLIIGLFLYYLIRDSILYIVIPWLLIRELI